MTVMNYLRCLILVPKICILSNCIVKLSSFYCQNSFCPTCCAIVHDFTSLPHCILLLIVFVRSVFRVYLGFGIIDWVRIFQLHQIYKPQLWTPKGMEQSANNR